MRPARTCTSCRSHARRCCARCATRRRRPSSARRSRLELVRATSLDDVGGGIPIHGGTEVVPLLYDGILQAEKLVDIRDVVPRGVQGDRIGAGTTLALSLIHI